MPPIYSGECSEDLAQHNCNPCPQDDDREFARTRSAGFIFSDYLAALMVNPTLLSVWLTGIQTGKIIVVPETSGEYDPGEPKVLKGYGDRAETYGARTMTLKFNDPNLAVNYAHYNGLRNQSELVPWFRTSSKLRIFDAPATILAKDPVADDLEAEVIWEVQAKVVSNNLPTYHEFTALKNTVFKCSYLNNIVVAPSFNTTLIFDEDVSDVAAGVTGTAGIVDADQQFSFNAIATPAGLPQSMSIKVSTVEELTVDYPDDYNALPFKYTDKAGVVHDGVFADGITNF